MATPKPTSQKPSATARTQTRAAAAGSRRKDKRRWPMVLVLIGLAVAVAGWFYREPILGYTSAGAAYSAHVGCSCVYLGGRSLNSCKTDRIAGMEMVSMSQDEDARSVTARFPLLPSQTATYREGFGCVLEKWED
ncbi:hypothetical protein [Allopontixanthobacter confluentis]|nr:hypothetical protein [Allopontixanthobacter confluentis]